MKRIGYFLTLLIALCLGANTLAVELARDGRTDWKIVLPSEPNAVERTAARC